jgi:(2R)-3-sulfolactate dehydrogenase (NADP+)
MIAVPDAKARLSAALGDGPAARLAASALVEADVLDLPRFGIAMLDEWTADTAPFPATRELQAISWRDCSACFAPLAVASATLELEAAARQFGLAAIFLRGVRGFGRLAPFVAPHGGTKAVIGTNPLAIAMGRGEERVVIDVASSSATMADVRTARAESRPLPEGIALDGDGRSTRVAAEVAALLPRGGQVGSLLGLVVELMAGIAGGGRGDPKGRGVFLLAFDHAAAGETIDWQAKLVGLKGEWADAGGHWPRGGGLPAEATLDAEFAQRLDAYLDRITGRGNR